MGTLVVSQQPPVVKEKTRKGYLMGKGTRDAKYLFPLGKSVMLLGSTLNLTLVAVLVL